MLLELLPVEGDITTIKIIRKLKESLSFTEEEYKLYGVTVTNSSEGTINITWDENKDTQENQADIQFGEKATDIICDAIENANKKKKLTVEHIDLYDKFMKKND